MNIKKLKVKLATHYHMEAIDGIYGASLQVKKEIEKELEQEAKKIRADTHMDSDELEWSLHSLGDDLFIAEITIELAGEMMIVALYKTIEIAIKQMTTASGLFTATQLKSFYKVAALKKQLEIKVCDIQNLKNYGAYNELRCINNAIKHSGIVSSELSSYPGFTKGERLVDLRKHYDRLKNDVHDFLLQLQSAILAKIPE